MLDDLRALVWRMEKVPLYTVIGVGTVIGAIWIAGLTLFISAAQRPNIDHTSIGLGAGSLAVVLALLYSPFIQRWQTNNQNATCLREVLYSQRLEDLLEFMEAYHFAKCGKLADRLIAIYQKHGLEPGLRARPSKRKSRF